jgi:hypothetical protein
MWVENAEIKFILEATLHTAVSIHEQHTDIGEN